MRQSTMQGGASVLIILIMICLTTFGVLALVSAYSDLKLARRNEEFLKEYYLLETQGEQAMEELEQAIARNKGENPDPRDLAPLGWQTQDGQSSQLYLDISEGLRHLKISIQLDESEPKGYQIISWQQDQSQFQYSAGEKLWDGQIVE